MQARQISERVSWLGVVDWDRCLFDSLIPLPDGTSYNAYLVQGSEKAALLDTVDPTKAQFLSIVGSYGWGGKTVKTLAGKVTNLKVEMLEPVLCKGIPKEDTLQSLDKLADLIARKHQEHGFA